MTPNVSHAVFAFDTPKSPEEYKKLILKLRWIGLEAEAAQLSRELSALVDSEPHAPHPRHAH